MNTKLLLLAAAATLTTAACSHEKTTETETTTVSPDSTTTVTTTTTVDTAAYRTEADMMADRVAQDFKIGDSTVVRRIKTVYYTRGRKLAAYTADTTGRYAALKAANDQAIADMAATLPPADYNTYTSNLNTYYAGQPYTVVVVDPARRSSPGVGGGSGVKKMEREDDGDKKTKYMNGAKVKRDDDGSVKIKRADGTKVKIDENGNRTVKKPLFK